MLKLGIFLWHELQTEGSRCTRIIGNIIRRRCQRSRRVGLLGQFVPSPILVMRLRALYLKFLRVHSHYFIEQELSIRKHAALSCHKDVRRVETEVE